MKLKEELDKFVPTSYRRVFLNGKKLEPVGSLIDSWQFIYVDNKKVYFFIETMKNGNRIVVVAGIAVTREFYADYCKGEVVITETLLDVDKCKVVEDLRKFGFEGRFTFWSSALLSKKSIMELETEIKENPIKEENFETEIKENPIKEENFGRRIKMNIV